MSSYGQGRAASNSGAWLKIKTGGRAEIQILRFGDVHDSRFAATEDQEERTVKVQDLDLFVYSETAVGDDQPTPVNTPKHWTPQPKWLVELYDLCDLIDKREGEGAIFKHKIGIVRSTRKVGQYDAAWIKVKDLGICTPPVQQSEDRFESAPAAAPVTVESLLGLVPACQTFPELVSLYQRASLLGHARTLVAPLTARKEAIGAKMVDDVTDAFSASDCRDTLQREFAKNPEALARLLARLDGDTMQIDSDPVPF